MKEIILSPEQDAWFKQTMYMNFYDLTKKVEALLEEYKQKTQSTQKIDSLGTFIFCSIFLIISEAARSFIDNLPQMKEFQAKVTKHVTLMEEILKQINVMKLFQAPKLQ